MSKAISISRGVICLTEAAFDEEAFGFVRTLLEMALNLRYITNGRSPEVRARRFIHFESKIKMEWRRRGITHFYWSKKESRDRLPSYERFVRLEKKYPRQGWYQTKRNRAWTGTLALEPDRHEKVAVRDEKGNFVLNKSGKTKLVQATWTFDYSWIYFWTSSFVHVDVQGVSNHAALHRVPFRVYQDGSVRMGSNTDLHRFLVQFERPHCLRSVASLHSGETLELVPQILVINFVVVLYLWSFHKSPQQPRAPVRRCLLEVGVAVLYVVSQNLGYPL